MKFKQINTTFFSQKHRRFWLSFIIVLFLFATTVSGYFLVKNSQDLRRVASDPYASTCFCDYGGNCDRGGNLPCDGGCSADCKPPGVCCKQPAEVACEPGERQCIGTYMGRYCSPTNHKWVDFTCPNNGKCTGAGICTTPSPTPIPLPTPTPPADCAATNQSCQSKACCNASDVCEAVYGGKFCISKGTECTSGQQKCVVEGSASYVYKCSSGGYYQKEKRCDFGCSGTTCKSACTPGVKRCSSDAKAIETCSSDGSAWSKQSCSSNYSCNSQSVTCVSTTPTCQGTCYTNSSCAAIGKISATGTCKYTNSVCCRDATTASGLKVFGVACSSDSECESGHCWAAGTMYGVGWQGQLLASTPTCQKESLNQANTALAKADLASAALATATIAGGAAVAPVFSLAGGSITALPTAAYVYGTTTLATAPAWVQTALSVAGVTSGWAAVGGGTYACVTNPNSAACDAFVAGMMADPSAMMSLANATDGLIGSAGNAINNYLNQQVEQMLDWTDGLGTSWQAVDQDVINYFYPTEPYNMSDQISGNVYSPAVNQTTNLAQSKIDDGMDIFQAIAQATNETLPPYWEGNNPVPGDSARFLEDLLTCDGVKCRHFTQLSTAVANNMGLDADFATFRIQSNNNQSGHAVTIVNNLNGPYGVIDATNPHLTNTNIADYVNTVKAGGWNIISNIKGALHGYNFQVLP